MAICNLCNLERIELSIMRDPTLTIRPPINDVSTVRSMDPFWPRALLSEPAKSFNCLVLSSTAEITVALSRLYALPTQT